LIPHAKFDQTACDSLADCVREMEQNTDAELVIVVRARSGPYRQADYLFGALLAFAGLLFLLFSPFQFHYFWVAIDVALLFVLGSYLSSRSNSIRRLFSSSKFRKGNARTGAAAMFYEAGIANTDAEMGVLVYLSLFERRLEVIADRGVLKAVPALKWNEIVFELHQVGKHPEVHTFVAAVRRLGLLLAEHLPATGENPDELPNMPRFELK
jgi:putative membrane protein